MKGEMLNKMLVLVANKFDKVYDKGGAPYTLHCLKVMHYLKTDDEELQCIALGHDLLEDTDVTASQLYDMGFTSRVVEGILNLTKIRGEYVGDYVNRIKRCEDSVKVKLADLRHNSDIRRLKGVTEKDIKRIEKYHKMYLELSEFLKCRE